MYALGTQILSSSVLSCRNCCYLPMPRMCCLFLSSSSLSVSINITVIIITIIITIIISFIFYILTFVIINISSSSIISTELIIGNKIHDVN